MDSVRKGRDPIRNSQRGSSWMARRGHLTHKGAPKTNRTMRIWESTLV